MRPTRPRPVPDGRGPETILQGPGRKEQAITTFQLIANNGFTTEDYPQPGIWADVIRRMGLRQFEYFADHMEPVIFREVVRGQSRFFQATLDAMRERGLQAWSAATARVSYLLNLLSHPYDDMRAAAREWLHAFIDLAVALQAPYISGHYDCISRPQTAELDRWMDNACDEIVLASEYAAAKGLKAIFLEQMHRPQLQPNTIERAHYMLDRINRSSAVPVHMHLDTGHMAHVKGDPAHTDTDKDPINWFGTPWGANEILLVHAQQTDDLASRHWPFTVECNGRGIIDAGEIIRAIEKSGVKRAVIALEVLFPRGSDIEEIEGPLVESAEYWRKALGEAGYSPWNDVFSKEPIANDAE
ncbi:MAG: sugar phosphate isomerase/epimerase [Planctomycetes bacterium]|nr:sugar phosphate isomerase/epimerase [Planctomycetota bacterium]